MLLSKGLKALAELSGWVLDSVYPERCSLCGATVEQKDWCLPGQMVPGLRLFDRPHLCVDCSRRLIKQGPVQRIVPVADGPDLKVWGAGWTNNDLTEVVGALKYHGVRGLAWPLGQILGRVLDQAQQQGMSADWIVPIPLHRRRRRQRGFNQSQLLAEIASVRNPIGVAGTLARRTRPTHQQAKLSDEKMRAENLADVFSAPVEGSNCGYDKGSSLILVDDLITSGATMVELCMTLRRQGWQVKGGLALGVAKDGN